MGTNCRMRKKNYVRIKGYIYKQKFIFDILANIVANKKQNKNKNKN